MRNALVITCWQHRCLSVTSWGSTHSRPAAQSLNCISFVDCWSWPVTHQQTKYPLCCESPEHKHQQTVPPLPTRLNKTGASFLVSCNPAICATSERVSTCHCGVIINALDESPWISLFCLSRQNTSQCYKCEGKS